MKTESIKLVGKAFHFLYPSPNQSKVLIIQFSLSNKRSNAYALYFCYWFNFGSIGDWRWLEMEKIQEKVCMISVPISTLVCVLTGKNPKLVFSYWRIGLRRVISKHNDLSTPLPLYPSEHKIAYKIHVDTLLRTHRFFSPKSTFSV